MDMHEDLIMGDLCAEAEKCQEAIQVMIGEGLSREAEPYRQILNYIETSKAPAEMVLFQARAMRRKIN